GNGALDAGEPALNGATVYLDSNNNGALDGGERSIITSGAGNYAFSALGDGNYTVRAITASGYVLTSAAALTPTISGGGAVGGQNFGYFPTTIAGSGGDDALLLRL